VRIDTIASMQVRNAKVAAVSQGTQYILIRKLAAFAVHCVLCVTAFLKLMLLRIFLRFKRRIRRLVEESGNSQVSLSNAKAAEVSQ